MNCPSRTDPEFPEGYNQNPNALNADATTRADLDFMANARARDDHRIDRLDANGGTGIVEHPAAEEDDPNRSKAFDGLCRRSGPARRKDLSTVPAVRGSPDTAGVNDDVAQRRARGGVFGKAIEVVRKYLKFVGPGFMVAVAYIDPG
jgi:metal iron transporter